MRSIGKTRLIAPRPGRTLATAVLLMGIAGAISVCSPRPEASSDRPSAAGSPAGVKYGVGDWDPESGLGNHRAVLRVDAPSGMPGAVWAHIPWRRRDADPAAKAVIVVDAASGRRIMNTAPMAIGRESGDIVFEPPTVPGDYHVYYLPYKSEGRKNYPQVNYDPPAETADPAWLAAYGLGLDRRAAARREEFPQARLLEIQSADEFSSFYPMEIIATAAETEALLQAHPNEPYLLFPEDRAHSIRMTGDLPQRWILTGPRREFLGEAARGEFLAFQIGLWAARTGIEDVDVRFSDFEPASRKSRGGSPAEDRMIPAGAAVCLNTGGVNWDGSAFEKTVPVERGRVQALWCGVRVPSDLVPGVYRGTVTIEPAGLPPADVAVELRVMRRVLEDGGDDTPASLSRLRWLNSTKALDDEIVAPFTAMAVDGRTANCLGRAVDVGDDGLPARIRSFFAPELTRLRESGIDILAAPMRFHVLDEDGQAIPLEAAAPAALNQEAPGTVTWKAAVSAAPIATRGASDNLEATEKPDVPAVPAPGSDPAAASGPSAEALPESAGSPSPALPAGSGGSLSLDVRGRMEFDGFVALKIALTAAEDMAVSDIALEIPLRPECAVYMMGLGFKGGLRPDSFEWTWDRTRNQDALWIGTINAGLQVSLRAENYSRPLNTNFYLSKPLEMPPSWWNEGLGTVSVDEVAASAADPHGESNALRDSPSVVLVRAASGPRTLRAGETLHFDVNLLLTPFKTIDPGAHFSQRYYHAFEPLEEVAETGANVINVHHANDINPYINYPFLRPAEMKAYIDEGHRRGFKVKIYNTIRELSNRAPEIFALRSLGHEIFSPGPGGGYSWLQEHLGGDYIAAWFVPDLKDAAVINSGMSRWHNYYIEGLDWLTRNVGIDGLYIDDVAFDRTTMKRVRKVLARTRPGALIDLHSANQYNPRDGFASSANLYLEHFPYIDRLWFGEYFDYDSAPDYWLVEMSGLPFGLLGEMLQGGGNPWRGMVFGMTSRLPWAGDPRPLWQAWDEFGLTESDMIGWWVEGNPVRTGRKDVLATVYVKPETAATAAGVSAAAPVSAAPARASNGHDNGSSALQSGIRSSTVLSSGRSGRALIALASWAPGVVDVKLAVDWAALGVDPETVVLEAPEIMDFQTAATFRPGEPIRLEPGRGRLLIVQNRKD